MSGLPARPRIGGLIVVFLAAAPLSSCDGPPEPPVRNAVLVSLDTVRADHLGAWGYPDGTTPHLDRLARRGAAFARCVAQAASTLPSHRSVFQSRVASHSGTEFPALAEILRDAGWATVAFTGGGNVAGELGFDRGFDRYEEDDAGVAWSVTRLAGWLGEDREPFFAFLHGYDAHVPYDPPPPYDELFDPGYEGPVQGPATRRLCRAVRGLDEGGGGPPELGARDRRHLVALYDGGLRALDADVGCLLRLLESRGLDRRTLLIVMSDHGEEFWDHGTLLHSHTVYQELVHVPLLMRDPHGVPGVLVSETVRNLEIAPTVLGALGIGTAPSHQGTSVLPRLRGERGEPLPAASEMRDWKSLTRYPEKLLVHRSERTMALYDLEEDPGETRNVLSRRRDRARALAGELKDLVQGTTVRELSPDEVSTELRERLRALGYVE